MKRITATSISTLAFLGLLLGSTSVFVGIKGTDAFQTLSALETTVGNTSVIVGVALFLGYLGTTKSRTAVLSP